MVGEKTATLLRDMGVETIKILSEIPVELMTNLLGKSGIELFGGLTVSTKRRSFLFVGVSSILAVM